MFVRRHNLLGPPSEPKVNCVRMEGILSSTGSLLPQPCLQATDPAAAAGQFPVSKVKLMMMMPLPNNP